MLVGTIEYFSKSHIPTREYEDEEHPFGWMEDGIFNLFDYEARLYHWCPEDEIVNVSDGLR